MLSVIPVCLSGQLLLEKGSVLVVGAGGLGCPVAVYLAAAGIGLYLHLYFKSVQVTWQQ